MLGVKGDNDDHVEGTELKALYIGLDLRDQLQITLLPGELRATVSDCPGWVTFFATDMLVTLFLLAVPAGVSWCYLWVVSILVLKDGTYASSNMGPDAVGGLYVVGPTPAWHLMVSLYARELV